MPSQTKITITYDKDTTVDIQNRLQNYAFTSKMQLPLLENELNRMDHGALNAILTIVVDDGNATAATGTATLVGVMAGDSILVNGVSFVAVASGATGNQFNIGGSDTITATNLAAAIVASVSPAIVGIVSATSVGNVVTVSSSALGIFGNQYDLESRGSGAITVTGAGAQAAGTLTFNTAGAATDTLTINGIVFTAVASGAVGNQWNVGATAALSATAAAAAINASASGGVAGYVFAVAAAGVLTVRASRVGLFGNEFTIAGGQASITASGARMTGGTDNAVVNFTGGVAATNSKTSSYKFGL